MWQPYVRQGIVMSPIHLETLFVGELCAAKQLGVEEAVLEDSIKIFRHSFVFAMSILDHAIRELPHVKAVLEAEEAPEEDPDGVSTITELHRFRTIREAECPDFDGETEVQLGIA